VQALEPLDKLSFRMILKEPSEQNSLSGQTASMKENHGWTGMGSGAENVTVRVVLTKKGDELTVDFSKSE
jgi:hypothetical protein